ncbi:hypothetical protein [Paraburkholderia sp. ZP32-5]|nr:hypothetical protein [Paraburkholderia sp. ZP32-5]
MQHTEPEQKEPSPFSLDVPGAGIDEGQFRREVDDAPAEGDEHGD